MDNKDIKMFILPYWSIITLTIIYALAIVMVSSACIIFFSELWWFIFVIILMSIIGIVAIKKEIFVPILINSQRVKYKECEYLWTEIRITICQAGTNGFNIIFSNKYAIDEMTIRSAYKKHLYTFLKMESLDIILRLSQHKIKIVNGKGEEMPTMKGYRKLQKRIDDFNASIN